MNLLKFLLDKGYTTMFSDFSLKALISEWDENLLGPLPFIKVGETSAPINLTFDSKALLSVPSMQLQILGELAQSGNTQISVEGGTIIYSIDPQVNSSSFYDIQVLTIARNSYINVSKYPLTLGGKNGSAGHVLLTYESGGHILTSMGHWIELISIDTS